MKKLKEDFETSGGVFKEWKMGDLFVFSAIKQAKSQALIPENHQGVPYIIQSTKNNMYKTHVDEQWLIENDENPVKGNAIVLGVTLPAVSYQPYKFGASQVITARSEFLNENVGSYIVSVLKKYIELFSYNAKPGMQIYKDMQVVLPTLNNSLALDYMEQYITMLEEEKMIQVDKFLKDSGLNDTTLTAEETSALEKFRNGGAKLDERKIGDLFEPISLKFLKKKFNKTTDVSKERNAEFSLPLVNAKNGDNGIMYYGRECDFEAEEMTIDIVNDGAISTGNVYAQPQKTGVLYNAYLVKLKDYVPNAEILLYYAMSMQKSIKLRFGYEKKASWERVKMESVLVPISSDKIDYDFMQHFISAQEKLAIKGVVKYKDEQLNAHHNPYPYCSDNYNLVAESPKQYE